MTNRNHSTPDLSTVKVFLTIHSDDNVVLEHPFNTGASRLRVCARVRLCVR